MVSVSPGLCFPQLLKRLLLFLPSPTHTEGSRSARAFPWVQARTWRRRIGSAGRERRRRESVKQNQETKTAHKMRCTELVSWLLLRTLREI